MQAFEYGLIPGLAISALEQWDLISVYYVDWLLSFLSLNFHIEIWLTNIFCFPAI